MDVVSECPLTVGSVLWQPTAEEWALTIVAKATFLLAPGASCFVPDAHAPVFAHDAFHDGDPGKSLVVASDLVPFKRRPEVLVVGHAYAPGGKPAESLIARLAIGAVDKAIEVRGDQFFALDGSLSAPLKIQRMPLRWERAAGGPGTSNPVGVRTGAEAGADVWGRFQLPNLLPVGCVPSSPREAIAPIGFGPLAPAWPTRAARLAPRARAARIAQWNASPLPEGFDAAYFNAAPPDQQLSLLDGSPSLLLENLHPRHPVLATHFAAPQPRATVDWGHGPPVEVPLAPDTIHIDTDRGIATLAYRGHLLLDYPTRTGRVLVRTDEPVPQRPVTRPMAAEDRTNLHPVTRAMAAEDRTNLHPVTRPMAAEDRTNLHPVQTWGAAADATAAPFRIDAPVSVADPLARSGTVALPFRPVEGARVGGSALGRSMRLQSTAPVPPSSPAPSPPPPASSRSPSAPPLYAPPPPASSRSPSAPPLYAPPPPASSRSPSAPPLYVPPPSSRSPSVPPLYAPPPLAVPPTHVARPPEVAPPQPPPLAVPPVHIAPPPEVAPPPSPFAPPPPHVAPPLAFPSFAPALAERPFVPPPTSTSEAPAPPPLIGPLASRDLAIEASANAAAPVAAVPETPATADEPAPAKATDPAPLPLATHPLERCAQIAASLARSEEHEARILDKHQLDKGMWLRLDEHWARAMREEAERQNNKLLKAYDAAYVAQLEEERGPIAVDEYARIIVAAERGGSDALMRALSLPLVAMMRIRRVWIVRSANDAGLGARVRRAVELERAR